MAPTVFISRCAAVESGMCGSSSGGWHSCLESYHDSSMACSTVSVASAPSSTLCMRSHSLSLFRRHRTHLQHKQTQKKSSNQSQNLQKRMSWRTAWQKGACRNMLSAGTTEHLRSHWRRPKQSFVKSAAWLLLDREKNKKEEERAQESPRILPSSISTSNNFRTASSRCNWSWYSRNSSRSASSSKSCANWTCSSSEPANRELIQTFRKAGSVSISVHHSDEKSSGTAAR